MSDFEFDRSYTDPQPRQGESQTDYRARRIVEYIEFLLLIGAAPHISGRIDSMFFWRDLDALATALGLDRPCIKELRASAMGDVVMDKGHPERFQEHLNSRVYKDAERAKREFREARRITKPRLL